MNNEIKYYLMYGSFVLIDFQGATDAAGNKSVSDMRLTIDPSKAAVYPSFDEAKAQAEFHKYFQILRHSVLFEEFNQDGTAVAPATT